MGKGGYNGGSTLIYGGIGAIGSISRPDLTKQEPKGKRRRRKKRRKIVHVSTKPSQPPAAKPIEEQAAEAALLRMDGPVAISAKEKALLDKVARPAPKAVHGHARAERRAAAEKAAAKAEAKAAEAAAEQARLDAATARQREMRIAVWQKLKAHREAKAALQVNDGAAEGE